MELWHANDSSKTTDHFRIERNSEKSRFIICIVKLKFLFAKIAGLNINAHLYLVGQVFVGSDVIIDRRSNGAILSVPVSHLEVRRGFISLFSVR